MAIVTYKSNSLKKNVKAEIFCKILSRVAEIEMETWNIDKPKRSKQTEVLDWTPTTLVDKRWEFKPWKDKYYDQIWK